MKPVFEQSSDSDDIERSKADLEHWHKMRSLNIKENEMKKNLKKFDKAKYEEGLSKRNPSHKSLPKKPDQWINNKVNAKRRAKFGAWKKMKVEPTTPDLLKRQLEKGREFKNEWWFSPSHVFVDVPEDEGKFYREKMSIMVREFFDVKEWMMSEFKKKNWGPILDRIRNSLTEIYQTQLTDEPRGKEMQVDFLIMAAVCAIRGLDNKLLQKIVKSGIEKGIDTNDFLVIRLCCYAMTKNWNYYSQIDTEIKFRIARNTKWFQSLSFGEIYIKAVELRKLWERTRIPIREMEHAEYSGKLQEIDLKVSDLSTLFGNSKWTEAHSEAGNLWEEIKEYASGEMQSMKQTTLRIFIESRIRMDKMDLSDEVDIHVWLDALYATGGRNFENVWLELLMNANSKTIPNELLVREAYGYLLDNFNTSDGEKMEQLERMNEVRKLLHYNTGFEWRDEAAKWFEKITNRLVQGKSKEKWQHFLI
jgi:hypothetical protein